MPDLLTRLQTFINLQKAVTVSVPGIVLAIAIVLMYSVTRPQPATSPSFDFKSAGADLKLPKWCDTLSAEQQLRSGNGRLLGDDWQYLHNRRWLLEDCVRGLQLDIVTTQSDSARLTSQIDADQKAADAFMKQYEDDSLKGIPIADRYLVLAKARLSEVNKNRAAVKNADSSTAVYNDLIARMTQEQKDVSERLKNGEQDEPFADFVYRLVNRAVYIALLGITLGFVLDPLTQQVRSWLYTDGRIERYNEAFQGPQVLTSSLRRVAALPPPPNGAPPKAPPRIVDVNYAIGYKLISSADVDALGDRYALTSQFGLGLILPLSALLVAVGLYFHAHPFKALL